MRKITLSIFGLISWIGSYVLYKLGPEIIQSAIIDQIIKSLNLDDWSKEIPMVGSGFLGLVGLIFIYAAVSGRGGDGGNASVEGEDSIAEGGGGGRGGSGPGGRGGDANVKGKGSKAKGGDGGNAGNG